MSDPRTTMDQAEQNRLTRQVGRALLTIAPQDWTEIRAEYRSAGRHIEVDVFVSGPDRVAHPVRPPAEVVEGLGRLRHGMYQPGRGTWLSAVYQLEPPSSFNAEFEPDVEPRWRRLPPPIGFQDELRFFPRTDDHIPDWLRQRAGLPPVVPQGDQPPAPPTPPTGFGQPPAAPPPPGQVPAQQPPTGSGHPSAAPPRQVPTQQPPTGFGQPPAEGHRPPPSPHYATPPSGPAWQPPPGSGPPAP